jgi:hypothetical protein
MQGESFVDLLEGTPRSGRRDWVLLDDGTGGVAGLRTARWKLMRDGGTRWRLYDLERDPGEKVDLLAQGVEPPPELDAMKAVVERELLRHAEFRRGLGAQADLRRGEGERARLEALGYADEPGP